MNNPKAGLIINIGGNTINKSQPNTYLGQYWATGGGDNGGVHANSGVQNYWFYLLSQGGSGVNDNGVSYSVSGIGIDSAVQIAYNTIAGGYVTSSATYNDAMNGSIQATVDLYGASSPKVQSVTDAWCAVGVGPGCGKSSAGIINELNNISVSVYPNPSNGSVTIANNSTLSELSVKVVNLLGQELKSYNINNNGDTQISLSQLCGGVYFLRIGNNTNFITKRLVLN